jgi:cysteine-rich repeat protein
MASSTAPCTHRLALLLFAATGCFGPSYPEGLPCSERETCPPGLRCDVDGICRSEPISLDAAVTPDASAPDGNVVPECEDERQNGMETDVDCGGGLCDPCGDDSMCEGPNDCTSAVCQDQRCAAAECGDGVTNGGEPCDTGGNSESCDEDCSQPACNDGVFNAAAETCDTGGNSESCDVDCTEPSCNDGVFNAAAETCDTGGNSESCDVDCTVPGCNDGVFNPAAEACDTGGTDTEGCDFDCTTPSCGDGHINGAANEQCDDRNQVSGDGCSASCRFERVFRGFTSWNQEATTQSDALQDAIMDSVCAAGFPGSRAASMDELLSGSVQGLPATNPTTFFVAGACPGCAGDAFPPAVDGHARNCVDPNAAFAAPFNTFCHTHPQRGAACIDALTAR